MKKISILLLLLVLISPNITLAKTEAGTTPDSFFYFFDTAFEKVNLFFTFNHEKKSEKLLEYAQERLAETEEMVKKEKTEDVEKLMNEYQENISFATDEIKNLEDSTKAEKLLATISETILKNEESLNTTLENIPEEIKTKIFQTIENAKKENEEAQKQIQELKQEVESLRNQVEELQKNNEVENEISNNNQDKEIKMLREQIQELKTESEKQKVSPTETNVEQSNNIITLPNGAIVEMGTNGNIVRYIKEAEKNSEENRQLDTTTNSNQNNSQEINSADTTNFILTLGEITTFDNSISIHWTTNNPSNSKLFLLGDDYRVIISDSGFSTKHGVTLENLVSATKYRYEIEAIDDDNNVKKLSGSFGTTDTRAPIVMSLDIQESNSSYDIHVASDEKIDFDKIKFYKGDTNLPIEVTLTYSGRSGENSIRHNKKTYTNYYIYRGTMSKYLTELANNSSFDFFISVPDMYGNTTNVQKHCRFFHSDDDPTVFESENGVSLESVQDKCMF